MKIIERNIKIDEIPDGWEYSVLEEVASVNEKTIGKDFEYSEIEYIDIASVDKGTILQKQKMKLKDAPSRAQRIIKKNDFIISTVRPNLKHFAFIKDANPNTIASTGFAVVTAKKVDSEYLYYFLTTDKYTDYLSGIADSHTSTYPAFNPDVLEESIITLPPLSEQRSIAKILSDLEEKIELNNKMNKTLEKIGKAIFKRWFVAFEFPWNFKTGEVDLSNGKPYKSSGGKMIESELGEIPEMWKAGTLNELCDITMGQSPEGKFLNEDGNGMPFYQGNRDFGFRFPKRRVFCTETTRLAKKKDVLISVRAPVGALNVADEDCCIGRGVAAIRMKIYKNTFIHDFLQTRDDLWANFNSEGTVFGCLNKTEFEKIELVIPESNVIDQFDRACSIMDDCIANNEQQTEELTQIRDSLLPKLMSGKIRVK